MARRINAVARISQRTGLPRSEVKQTVRILCDKIQQIHDGQVLGRNEFLTAQVRSEVPWEIRNKFEAITFQNNLVEFHSAHEHYAVESQVTPVDGVRYVKI